MAKQNGSKSKMAPLSTVPVVQSPASTAARAAMTEPRPATPPAPVLDAAPAAPAAATNGKVKKPRVVLSTRDKLVRRIDRFAKYAGKLSKVLDASAAADPDSQEDCESAARNAYDAMSALAACAVKMKNLADDWTPAGRVLSVGGGGKLGLAEGDTVSIIEKFRPKYVALLDVEATFTIKKIAGTRAVIVDSDGAKAMVNKAFIRRA